jgi:hypothetical protein
MNVDISRPCFSMTENVLKHFAEQLHHQVWWLTDKRDRKSGKVEGMAL